MPTTESAQAVQAETVRPGDEAKGGDANGSSLQKTDATQSFETRLAAAKSQGELDQIAREQAEASTKTAGQDKSDKAKDGAEEEDAEGDEGKKGESEEKSKAGDAAEGTTEEKAEGEKEAGKGEGKKPDDDDDDDEPEAGSGKSQQIRTRIAEGDEVGKLAMVILKGNNGRVKAGLKPLTLEAATAQAKHELGLDKAKDGEGKKDEGQEKSGLPETLEATEAEITRLRNERTKALTEEVDLAKADALDRQIDALKDHKFTLREQAVTTAKTERAEYDRQFDESKAKAVDAYEFVSDPESEGAKRMTEIDAEMENSGDPTFNDPDKPLIIAQMVARELRIAPRKKGEAKTETKSGEAKAEAAGKPAAKPVAKSVVASGASRTVTTTTQQSQRHAEIDGIKNLSDLGKFGVGGLD